MAFAFDGPPAAFIIMNYIIGLMAITLALLGAQKWHPTLLRGTLWGKGPFIITLFGYGLFLFYVGFVASALALINVMIGVEKHTLDGLIIALLAFMHIYPLITLVWWVFRGRKFKLAGEEA